MNGDDLRNGRIGLVGCVKQKGASSAPARDLYTSPLFRGRRRYVESSCAQWYILSALHGLVAPDELLDPYDESLTNAGRARRRRWADEVLTALDDAIADHRGLVYEIHAGATYRDFGLVDGLRRRDAIVEIPTEGLTQGEQLAFYARRSHPDAAPSTPAMSSAVVDVAEQLVAALTDPANRQPASDFPVDRHAAAQPGLYSWWCNQDGRRVLAGVLGAPVANPIYAGQAGATTTRSAIERSATLASRIRSNHLGGSISSSTFRRTLAAILLEPLDLRLVRPGRLDAASNEHLSGWMRTHLSVAIAPHPDRATVAAAEAAVLHCIDPPLNLSGMVATRIRSRLSVLRKRLADETEAGSSVVSTSRRDAAPQSAMEAPPSSAASLDPGVTDVLALVQRAVLPGDVIHTISSRAPNRIEGIGPDGMHVSTAKSDAEGSGPQLVPM
jgi:Family of unknown function (DUF6884)/GIY-YIG catalytic domain